jgi:hypothetical protein
MGSATLEHDAGITSQAKEGFERTHLPKKIQFHNIARGSTGEVRSLLYIISDNYPRSAPVAERLRSTAIFSWEARLRPFAVDRRTERQTPTSTVASARAISYLLGPIFR